MDQFSSSQIPTGSDREILLVLYTQFGIFAQSQERINATQSERLSEILHHQNNKADKLDIQNIQHELAKKADKTDFDALMRSDKDILGKVESLDNRVKSLEERNSAKDNYQKGRDTTLGQVRGLGVKAWAFILGAISFGIMIIEFIKK